MPNILKAVDFMKKIAKDDSHGYDQAHRNSPDYDCSSLVATALNQAGFDVSTNSWTGNLYPQLKKCGFEPCHAPWKAGDIHLKPNYHVAMSVSASEICEASINEKGTITGGRTGDQTGKEIWIHPYYEYTGGWKYHLRYPEQLITTNDSEAILKIAKDVINGKFGNMPERKERVEAMGYDYETVRKKVNELLKLPKEKNSLDVALEVIAGKWGNGIERKNALEEAGYDYEKIQKIVNNML